MAKLVSKTYGDAFFQLAVEAGKVEELLPETKEVLKLLKENGRLLKLMNHPQIGKEEKTEILARVFKGRISDELLGLMELLVTRNHSDEMESVFTYFIEQGKEYKNIGTAYVTSALPLGNEQKEKVQKKLLETTGYESLEMRYEVEPGLIGGMVIRIGDRVVDSSIRTRLSNLTRELSKIQLKAGECAP